jgi:hypothetical protein
VREEKCKKLFAATFSHSTTPQDILPISHFVMCARDYLLKGVERKTRQFTHQKNCEKLS